MRLGHQRLDLGDLADRERFASDLLRSTRRSLIKRCADKQHGVNRGNNCPRSTKQYCLRISLICHVESLEDLRTSHLSARFACALHAGLERRGKQRKM